ncbi:hypothetical protein QUV83_14060 [Cellulomonas cellasea]|uniref:hypothetical protein n=1 Tax=Cellulomonas cellasea TaxID=43670 RepID=UPI0025A3E291|nr:hypothetical protein [Cellulomonas cellasea]MDM8085897.1 hypothetical protein [Cellulomonas cellasea]
MNKKTVILSITATLAVIAVGSGVLVGCSSDDTTPAVPAATETPATVETPAAPAVETPEITIPDIGSAITTPEEEAAAKAAGLGVYQTSAGALVVVDPAAPAAQVIIDDALATGNGAEVAATSAQSDANFEAITVVAQRAYEATGKKLAFIVKRGRYLETGERENGWDFYSFISPTATELRISAPGRHSTSESAIALVQERIAAQPDPSAYEIIDLTK